MLSVPHSLLFLLPFSLGVWEKKATRRMMVVGSTVIKLITSQVFRFRFLKKSNGRAREGDGEGGAVVDYSMAICSRYLLCNRNTLYLASDVWDWDCLSAPPPKETTSRP